MCFHVANPMDSAIRLKLTFWLEHEKIECGLLTAASSVDWASGHETPIETGPNPFAGGPTVLLVEKNTATLLYPDCEVPDLGALGLEGLAYASYTPDHTQSPSNKYRAALRELIAGKSNLGVEYANFPGDLAATLVHAKPIDGRIDPLRAVKTPGEITAIRAALELCDLAQAILPKLVQPGRSELAIWGDLRVALESKAGRDIEYGHGQCLDRRTRGGQLHRGQGWRHRSYPQHGAELRQIRHSREFHQPRICHHRMPDGLV